MLLAHISDLHAGENKTRPRVLMDMARAVVASNAQVCIVTGDITDNARDEEFREVLPCLSYIQRFMPVELVPGNHDCGFKGIWGSKARYQAFHKAMGPVTEWVRKKTDYPTVLEHKGFRFIGLDSTQGVLSRPWSLARGMLGQEQLNGLRAAMQGDKPKIIYLHHHPFDRGLGLELLDAGQLVAAVSGGYHLLLYGHKHEASERGHMIAACKTPESRRFRVIELESRSWQWVGF